MFPALPYWQRKVPQKIDAVVTTHLRSIGVKTIPRPVSESLREMNDLFKLVEAPTGLTSIPQVLRYFQLLRCLLSLVPYDVIHPSSTWIRDNEHQTFTVHDETLEYLLAVTNIGISIANQAEEMIHQSPPGDRDAIKNAYKAYTQAYGVLASLGNGPHTPHKCAQQQIQARVTFYKYMFAQVTDKKEETLSHLASLVAAKFKGVVGAEGMYELMMAKSHLHSARHSYSIQEDPGIPSIGKALGFLDSAYEMLGKIKKQGNGVSNMIDEFKAMIDEVSTKWERENRCVYMQPIPKPQPTQVAEEETETSGRASVAPPTPSVVPAFEDIPMIVTEENPFSSIVSSLPIPASAQAAKTKCDQKLEKLKKDLEAYERALTVVVPSFVMKAIQNFGTFTGGKSNPLSLLQAKVTLLNKEANVASEKLVELQNHVLKEDTIVKSFQSRIDEAVGKGVGLLANAESVKDVLMAAATNNCSEYFKVAGTRGFPDLISEQQSLMQQIKDTKVYLETEARELHRYFAVVAASHSISPEELLKSHTNTVASLKDPVNRFATKINHVWDASCAPQWQLPILDNFTHSLTALNDAVSDVKLLQSNIDDEIEKMKKVSTRLSRAAPKGSHDDDDDGVGRKAVGTPRAPRQSVRMNMALLNGDVKQDEEEAPPMSSRRRSSASATPKPKPAPKKRQR